MNTHTNAMHPQKQTHRTIRNNLFRNAAIMTLILALVTAAAIAVNTANRPVVAENGPAALYSNALEMQYAQPWLEAQNKSAVAYSNALEMQYAKPWLAETKLMIPVTGSQTPLDCHGSLEMLYACKYGYALP